MARSAVLLAALLLAACGGSEADSPYAVNSGNVVANKRGLDEIFEGSVKFAAVSADESRAAEIGRDILGNGGNATDAAVAMYFAMTVTLPSAASLGASGACIVHDSKSLAAESFVFGPVAAPGPIKGVAFTVPTAVRAMTLMQIRHGKVQWQMDVAPAEKLARFGVPVSRAFARDLRAGSGLLVDGEARRLYTRNGAPLTEGDMLVLPELAGTLGIIRQRGGIDMFQGNAARLMSDQVAQLGGSLPLEALRASVPQAGPPAAQNYNGYKVYVAPGSAGASALAGWNGEPGTAAAPTGDSGGFAGVAAMDEKGGAAACSLSMGQLFGARIVVPATGILLGAMTPDGGAPSPLVIGNPNNGEAKFAGAGGGSASASHAVGLVARATVYNGQTVGNALAARAGQGGYVDAIACPKGIKGGGDSCSAATDPASGGLALKASDR